MQVIIERTLGGFTVSKAVEYGTVYYAEYTAMRFGVNIFGQRLDSFYPREVQKMRCIQTRIKAGVALSQCFKNEVDAIAWAKSQGLVIFNGRLHESI